MWMGFWQKGHISRSMGFPQWGHESKSKRFELLLRRLLRLLRYSDLFIVYSCIYASYRKGTEAIKNSGSFRIRYRINRRQTYGIHRDHWKTRTDHHWLGEWQDQEAYGIVWVCIWVCVYYQEKLQQQNLILPSIHSLIEWLCVYVCVVVYECIEYKREERETDNDNTHTHIHTKERDG